MRDRVAEELLARVLEWASEDVARERPLIQALAEYKYDEYQQFSTGSRFIESLALWLNQFDTTDERRVAYDFVKNQLLFCSGAEMRHFVEMAYPDHIRPFLIKQCAGDDFDRYRPSAVAQSTGFKVRQRQCLFLGLSDGARIDAFRRANANNLNHEQIWQTYELGKERVDKLLEKLEEHLGQILGRRARPEERRFRTLVLLDDFSASGTSYYAHPATGSPGGKLVTLSRTLFEKTSISRLIDKERVEIFVLLYMATEQALRHVRRASASTWGERGVNCIVEAVAVLADGLRIPRNGGEPINQVINGDSYYDPTIHDAHMKKGKTPDSRYGYGDCGLPLVLHHNTPNNSVSLLMSYDDKSFRGLFPRVQRHREMS